MLKYVKKYFKLSYFEFYVGMLLLAIFWVSLLFLTLFEVPNKPFNVSTTVIAPFLTKQATFNTRSLPSFKPSEKIAYALKPFHFDPNTLTIEEWVKLGIPEFKGKSFINYVNKGGKFRDQKDWLKFKALPDSVKNALLPYLKIAQITPKPFNYPVFTLKAKPIQLIDLNQADTTLLAELPYIGPTTARRIVAYRERLGGFLNLNQLKEVWGIDTTIIEKLNDKLRIDQQTIRYIKINTIQVEEAKHPYLTKKQFRTLINYRNQHGAYKTLEDLLKSDALTPPELEKIKPYISLN